MILKTLQHNTHWFIQCSFLLFLVTDLSHNRLGSRTGRALGKLLNVPSCPLETLVITNNEIGIEGGNAIGHALKNNTTLLSLNLRMNRYVILVQ